jgi:hypothetical protein
MNRYRQIISDRNKRTFLLDDSMPSSSVRLFGAGLATALDFFTFVSSVTGSDEIRIERRGADDSPSVTARVGLRGGITVHTAAVWWTSKKLRFLINPQLNLSKSAYPSESWPQTVRAHSSTSSSTTSRISDKIYPGSIQLNKTEIFALTLGAQAGHVFGK